MADHYYSVVVGEQLPKDVTFGTSSSSEAVELRVTDSTTGMTKLVLLRALEAIKDYIITHDAPA